MKEYADNCAGCETCMGCGRDRTRIVYTCDKCGRDEDDIYTDGDEDLCQKCAAKKYADDLIEWLVGSDALKEWAEENFERRGN